MIPEAEVLKVLTEVLTELKVGGFKVKLSNRKLLDALMDVSGVPPEKFRTICSAVDKLDKMSWKDVKREMTVDKGLPEAAADKLGTFVASDTYSGLSSMDLLHALQKNEELTSHARAKEGLTELETLFNYLQSMGCLDKISFDLSLARGLNYYTGTIYEAVLTDTNRLGSVAAGGRYDNLVGMFSSQQVPAVGVSVGIGRLLAVLADMERKRSQIRKTATQVYVASVGDGLLEARMSICRDLWSAGIPTEFMYHLKPKANKQLTYTLESGIPWMVWTGADEDAKGYLQLKHMATQTQIQISRTDVVAEIQKAMAEVGRSGKLDVDQKEN